MRQVDKQTAFTLIELLLAVTIFAIVASVIYSSFRLGLLSYRRIEANLTRYQNIRYAMNLLTEDLTNAFKHKAIKFVGEETKIEFAGYLKSAGSQGKALGKIAYKYAEEKLLRQELPYKDAVKEEAVEGGEELLSGVIDFSLNYCYTTSKETELDIDQLQWQPQWLSANEDENKDEDAIPKGVKIELALKDDYSPQGKIIFSKRITIPAGELGKLEELEKAEK